MAAPGAVWGLAGFLCHLVEDAGPGHRGHSSVPEAAGPASAPQDGAACFSCSVGGLRLLTNPGRAGKKLGLASGYQQWVATPLFMQVLKLRSHR